MSPIAQAKKPEKPDAERSLSQRSLTALKWNYLGSFSRVGLQFVVGIVLARILGPEPFGLVALATLVIGFGALFADFGLASALVQRQDVSDRDVRFVFTLQSLMGFLLTAVLAFSATPIAEFFRRPDAVPVLQLMFLSFAIQGLGQTATALMRRVLDFRRAQIAQLASYLIGYVLIGLPLAFHGAGVWSLVVAHLVQTTLGSVFAYVMTRHPIRPCFSGSDGSLFNFGVKVTITNISNWGLSCSDSVVLGRFFGVTELGLYNRAFSLVAMPTYNLVSSLQGVLFSATARAQKDVVRLRDTYLAAVGVLAFISFPVFGVVAVMPETMILGIYGSKWAAAEPLLPPLALAMPFSALMGLAGPIMTGVGRVEREMYAQSVSLFLFLGILLWAARYNMQTVAWAVFSAYVFRFVLMSHLTLRLLDARWSDLFDVVWGPLVVTMCAALAAYGVDRVLLGWEMEAPLRVLAVGCVGGIVALVATVILQRWLVSRPVAQFVRRILPSLPRGLRGFVRV